MIDVKKLISENKKLKKKEKDKFNLKYKIPHKEVIKPSKTIVHIPTKQVESSWDDENRFFKGQFEKEKRLFFE